MKGSHNWRGRLITWKLGFQRPNLPILESTFFSDDRGYSWFTLFTHPCHHEFVHLIICTRIRSLWLLSREKLFHTFWWSCIKHWLIWWSRYTSSVEYHFPIYYFFVEKLLLHNWLLEVWSGVWIKFRRIWNLHSRISSNKLRRGRIHRFLFRPSLSAFTDGEEFVRFAVGQRFT